MMMLSLLITLSSLFFMMKHPLTMTMMVIMQTALIALITGLMNKTFWFSYIMFMIMVGGMLVVIIYMTSTASNEKFKMNNWMLMMFMLIIMLTLMASKFNLMNSMMVENCMLNYSYPMSLNKFFSSSENKIMIMMFIYLFITLIAIVKITSLEKGPLRQKY